MENPPTIQDANDMCAETDNYVWQQRRLNMKLAVCPEFDHPEYCECQIATKLEAQGCSARFHWYEAMERARVEGEQKRQQQLDEFAALRAKREQESGKPKIEEDERAVP